MGIYLPLHEQSTHHASFSTFLENQVVHFAMNVQCQERDLPLEKHGVCQVRVVYFWAVDVCLLWTTMA